MRTKRSLDQAPLKVGDQVELGGIRGELVVMEPGKAVVSRGGLAHRGIAGAVATREGRVRRRRRSRAPRDAVDHRAAQVRASVRS